ncbi:MAG: SGNH/GDSL hydrolase family protein [Nitrospirae bacterium]|nr:SGNH/GDSL hydrolase family protein [Nitrospirota bacterium]MBF0616404.1 SGNH/GDSL hydrolase family protein [Nitrospirota bacterium]
MKKVRLSVKCIAVVLIIISTIIMSECFAELFYYIQNKDLYFLLSKQVNKRDSMALYRDPFQIKKTKPYRIIAIGGSTTYGFGVSPEHTWPKRLENILKGKFNDRYEVINLGRLGGHLSEFMQNYENSINVFISRENWMKGQRPLKDELADWGWKDLKPDMVILSPVINDTAPDYLYLSSQGCAADLAGSILAFSGNSFFFRSFALGFYVKKALVLIEIKNRLPFENNDKKLAMIKNEYKKNLEKFISLFDDKNVQIIVFGFPLLFNTEDSGKQADLAAMYWNLGDVSSVEKEAAYLPKLEALETEVRAEVALKNHNVRYKELGKKIKSLPFKERLKLYVDSCHLNDKGVELLTEEMYEFIFQK